MARPAKQESEKRQLIGARFDPDVREKLDSYITESGRSAGAEVERRVRATIDLDEAGLRLIETISSEIAEIQTAHGDRLWHEDLVVWSAVAHMLRTGPIMLSRPESPNDDPTVAKAYEKVKELKNQRKGLIEQAAAHGLAWLENPKHKELGNMGLFGKVGPVTVDARKTERATIDSLDDSPGKDKLAKLHQRVCELDKKIEEADAKWTEYLRPYWDGEREGRQWNRTRQMERASKALKEGRYKDVDLCQLAGTDPWFAKE